MRKGQKLCNWILSQGYDNESVHQKLFNMTDKEFYEALNDWKIYRICPKCQKADLTAGGWCENCGQVLGF